LDEGRSPRNFRCLHKNFNFVVAWLISLLSLCSGTLIDFCFRSPSMALWLIVPRGWNEERCISLRFFFHPPSYSGCKGKIKRIICGEICSV
jgi:hypothetical protein